MMYALAALVPHVRASAIISLIAANWDALGSR